MSAATVNATNATNATNANAANAVLRVGLQPDALVRLKPDLP